MKVIDKWTVELSEEEHCFRRAWDERLDKGDGVVEAVQNVHREHPEWVVSRDFLSWLSY